MIAQIFTFFTAAVLIALLSLIGIISNDLFTGWRYRRRMRRALRSFPGSMDEAL